MTRDVFEQFVAALRFSYEQRMPTDDILSFWYSKVSFIPEASLEFCRDVIKESNPQYFPKHFHDKLTAAYYQWRRETEQQDGERGCPECDCGWVEDWEYCQLYPEPISVMKGCKNCNAGIANLTWMDNEKKRCRILLG